MGIINFEDIQSGMILGNDIKDQSGVVLLSAGNEITERHLRILRMWGITEANIQGVEREEVLSTVTAQIDPSLLKEAETQVLELFRHNDQEHPFIHELFRLLTLRMALDRMKEENHGS